MLDYMIADTVNSLIYTPINTKQASWNAFVPNFTCTVSLAYTEWIHTNIQCLRTVDNLNHVLHKTASESPVFN